MYGTVTVYGIYSRVLVMHTAQQRQRGPYEHPAPRNTTNEDAPGLELKVSVKQSKTT